MSCSSNLTEQALLSVYKENLVLGNATVVDDCAVSWNKIGIQTFTREVSVLDFGADRTGAADSTAAFTLAMAALPNGGTIIVPEGLYSVNLVITGDNFHFKGQQQQYSSTGGIGLSPYDTSLPTVQVGNGTTTTSNIRFSNFHIRKSGGTGTKGIKFYGCNRVYFDHISVRAFTEYQIQLDSSASKSTSFIYLSHFNIATAGVGTSLGIDFNYGSTFTTAVFVTNTDLSAAAGGSYLVDLAASCEIRMTDCWFDTGNNMGIHFATSTAKLRSSDTIIDSGSSNDILLTFDFDGLVGDSVVGNINVDGKCAMTSGNTATLTNRSFASYQSLFVYPHIQGQLGFEDTSAAKNLQHTSSDPAQNIYRDGTTLNVRSTDGKIGLIPKTTANGGTVEVTQGALEIKEAPHAGSGSGVVFGKNSQTTVGAAGGASALPATPTGYLRFFYAGTEYVLPYYARA